jgi:hypothetical protein
MSDDRLDRIEDKIDRLALRVDEMRATIAAFIQIQSAINGKLRSRAADHERRILTLDDKRP